MIHSPDISTPSTTNPLTRRRFLTGGLAAGAALTVTGLLSGRGTASADILGVDAPGKALESADRVGTSPVGAAALPADGEILFPIIVQPGDRAYLNKNFGACRGSGCSRSHEGTDIMAERGLPIRAVAAGVLTKQYTAESGKTTGAGNGWTLFCADTQITWKFFHMDRHEDGLETDDVVEMGQIIGYVGNTGTSGANSESNYHLHFEYRPGNVAQDSYALLQRDPNVTFI